MPSYISERLERSNGEITQNGFLELNDLEAEDSNGDEDDMWVTLESLGFNKELVMDEVPSPHNPFCSRGSFEISECIVVL
jgi:hypothetical protein